MALPRGVTLNDREKHILKIIEQFAWRNGERILASKVLNEIDWDNFNYKEINSALDDLAGKDIIAHDTTFITRRWS